MMMMKTNYGEKQSWHSRKISFGDLFIFSLNHLACEICHANWRIQGCKFIVLSFL
jgi:hypothetical protein